MVVLPLLLISGLLIVVFALATLGSARHAPWLAVAAIYPLTLAVDRYILFRLRARRTYRQQESLRAPYVMRIDAAGLQFNSDFVNTREPWSHFRKWAESEDVFLLYYSDVSFMIVPKRLFPLGDEVEQLRALLARRIGLSNREHS
ncbi:MAG: hypothetical protein GTN62_11650 [Gemmatimonadales bacterium]|nr:hypothetical protein [Gemmatimonadales bacterium]NIN50749.1 hypothetical protein [Gemmatimonadales bacterium]NIP08213.1 hypothetical protein [Gemmatimonadales bacterium]